MVAFLRRLDAAVTKPWVWPVLLVLAAAGALIAAWLVTPTSDPTVLTLFGEPFGGGCAFKDQTGLPCPQCGMTRSWVWAARGNVLRAATFSVSGAGLFVWIVVAGGIGAARLATRRWNKWEPPWQLLAGWVFLWLALYGGGWFARISGYNMLPEQHTDVFEIRAARAAQSPDP